MNTKASPYFCWLPTFFYVLYVLYMQHVVHDGFWLKGAMLSFFATFLYLACFVQLIKKRTEISKKVVLLFNGILSSVLLFLALFVGKDAETALITGVGIHSVTALFFAFRIAATKNNIVKEKDTGVLYRIKGGKAHRLSENEVKQYISISSNGSYPLKEFSLNSCSGADVSASVIPLVNASNDFANPDFSHGVDINPSSGIPMIGGMSGLDIHGNSWGTNFNEPSNTYDPNRGY